MFIQVTSKIVNLLKANLVSPAQPWHVPADHIFSGPTAEPTTGEIPRVAVTPENFELPPDQNPESEVEFQKPIEYELVTENLTVTDPNQQIYALAQIPLKPIVKIVQKTGSGDISLREEDDFWVEYGARQITFRNIDLAAGQILVVKYFIDKIIGNAGFFNFTQKYSLAVWTANDTNVEAITSMSIGIIEANKDDITQESITQYKGTKVLTSHTINRIKPLNGIKTRISDGLVKIDVAYLISGRLKIVSLLPPEEIGLIEKIKLSAPPGKVPVIEIT